MVMFKDVVVSGGFCDGDDGRGGVGGDCRGGGGGGSDD